MKFCGTYVNIHPFSVLAAGVLIYTNFSRYTLIVFLCASIHELGHFAYIKRNGIKIHAVSFFPYGADIKVESRSYKDEFLLAFFGPAANVVSALIAGCACAVVKRPEIFFAFLANVLLCITNLLPIKSLDGGRMLECLLCQRLEIGRALKICDTVSAIALGALAVFSFVMLRATKYNVSFLFICAYLYISLYLCDGL